MLFVVAVPGRQGRRWCGFLHHLRGGNAGAIVTDLTAMSGTSRIFLVSQVTFISSFVYKLSCKRQHTTRETTSHAATCSRINDKKIAPRNTQKHEVKCCYFVRNRVYLFGGPFPLKELHFAMPCHARLPPHTQTRTHPYHTHCTTLSRTTSARNKHRRVQGN